MNVIAFLRRILGLKKYTYYVLVMKERYSNNDLADMYFCSYIFPTKNSAKKHAEHLRDTALYFDTYTIEKLRSDNPYTCVDVEYSQGQGGRAKIKVNNIAPE